MLREAREKGAAILKARGDAGTGGPFSRGEVKSVAYMGNVEEMMSPDLGELRVKDGAVVTDRGGRRPEGD